LIEIAWMEKIRVVTSQNSLIKATNVVAAQTLALYPHHHLLRIIPYQIRTSSTEYGENYCRILDSTQQRLQADQCLSTLATPDRHLCSSLQFDSFLSLIHPLDRENGYCDYYSYSYISIRYGAAAGYQRVLDTKLICRLRLSIHRRYVRHTCLVDAYLRDYLPLSPE
jgi:hypothetical protein